MEQEVETLTGLTSCCTCFSLGGACLGPDCFENTATCMDALSEYTELLGRVIGCLVGPWCFPIVYCFPTSDDLGGREWDVKMEYACLKQPHVCCCSLCCLPCTQFGVRYKVLDDDLSRYKCFQGRADGPYCLAVCKPELPFTFEAGTIGDAGNPLCLCLEVACCPLCAFNVSREVQRDDRGLGYDPTEIRVNNCLNFFGQIAQMCFCAGCCLKCAGCCAGCCLGEDDFAESSDRLGNACINVAHGIWRGMRWIILISTACMSAQMTHEAALPKPDGQQSGDVIGQAQPPQQVQMDPGLKGTQC